MNCKTVNIGANRCYTVRQLYINILKTIFTKWKRHLVTPITFIMSIQYQLNVHKHTPEIT